MAEAAGPGAGLCYPPSPTHARTPSSASPRAGVCSPQPRDPAGWPGATCTGSGFPGALTKVRAETRHRRTFFHDF